VCRIIALRRPKALANGNITHVVSVIDWKFHDESPLIKDFQHLHISVDDVDEENLIEHFARSNAFIKEGLNYRKGEANVSTHFNSTEEWTGVDGGSGVLIHW
jgi:dual specificity phosphatase 12